MKENPITVLMVAPGEHPEVVELENNLESLQDAVSIGASCRGLIEIIEIDDEGTCLLCNEEGKLIGLAGNRRVGCDIIAGVFYLTGQDKEGNLASLSHELIEKYKEMFWKPESYTRETVEAAACVEIYPWEVCK